MYMPSSTCTYSYISFFYLGYPCTLCKCVLLYFITDKPDAPMNVRIPEMDITSESFVVKWDAVTDLFTVNYTIRWYGEDGINGTVTVNGLSCTVTGLNSSTSYSVTVSATNTCGAGLFSDVIMTMTNMKPTTPQLHGNYVCMYGIHACIIGRQ